MIITSGGTTVKLQPCSDCGSADVILDHPDAPANLREVNAGRVTNAGGGKGFQPSQFADFSMSPEVLRAIARLMEASDA